MFCFVAIGSIFPQGKDNVTTVFNVTYCGHLVVVNTLLNALITLTVLLVLVTLLAPFNLVASLASAQFSSVVSSVRLI